MKGRRIFAAIDISDEARRRVTEYVSGLRREFSHLRVGWERPEKLHITVKFAGYLSDDELRDFVATATKAARTCKAFDAAITGTGAFVKRRGSNVLWLGLDAEPLAKLAAAFDPTPKSENERVKRSFDPHLTIARLREPEKSRELIDRHLASDFQPIRFRVSGIVIYESTLLPTGSVYTAVSKLPFAEAG